MKNLTLKVALVAVATFAGLNGFAQTNKGAGVGGWPDHATINEYVSTAGNKVTINQTMPFWVWPSAAYNPDFDYSLIGAYATKANITNNVKSHFAWTAGVLTDYTLTQDATPNDFNYVTIAWKSVGTKTISVVETPASGVCPGAAVTFDVTVIDVPSFTITTAATKFGLARLIKSACWAALHDNETQIPFTVGNTDEDYPYAFYLDYKIYNVDGLDASGNVPVDGSGNIIPGVAPVSAALAYDNKVNGVVAGVPNKTTNPIRVVSPNTNLLAALTDFEVKNNKITVYEFDMSGYNGKVSRTSDYLALTAANVNNYSTYTQYGTAGKYYIVSLPTPVTGPIYHISNTFAY